MLAGIEVALEAFRQLDPQVTVGETRRRDGDTCAPQEVVTTIDGRAAALLGGERTALNFLQRLSGIATLARRYVEAAAGRTVILDTRKTTPTLRVLEKYAVRVGGAANHRFGLGHGILIKDNHIQMAGSLIEAVRRGPRLAGAVRADRRPGLRYRGSARTPHRGRSPVARGGRRSPRGRCGHRSSRQPLAG